MMRIKRFSPSVKLILLSPNFLIPLWKFCCPVSASNVYSNKFVTNKFDAIFNKFHPDKNTEYILDHFH